MTISTTMSICLAALSTACALLLLQPLAFKLGLVDRPGGRKQHDRLTPLTGGIAIAIGLALTAPLIDGSHDNLVGLAIAGLSILLLGALDDRYDVRWYLRLAAQVGTAFGLVQMGGVRIESLGPIFGSAPVHLDALSVPVSVLAIVGLINALNMCDGIDGLAGSLSLCAFAMLAAAAAYSGNLLLASEIAVIMGALAGFLFFNIRFPWQKRATAFLGDAGSGMLGLMIAWASFRLTQDAAHPVPPILAPFLIAPPLIDCLVLMARRMARKASPFAADRGHMHHILLDAGWAPSSIVGLLGGSSLVLGGLGGLCLWAKLPDIWFIGGFASLTASYFAFSFRPEFAVWSLAWLRTAGVPARSAPALSVSATPAVGATSLDHLRSIVREPAPAAAYGVDGTPDQLAA